MQSPEHAGRTDSAHEIDLRTLGKAIQRRRRTILVPTFVAFVLVAIFVNVVTPRYTAESQVLLENQENFFTRPDRINQPEQTLQVDQEGVASQVQLISSRDIARRAIKKLGLAGNPEFDPLADGLNPFTRILILLGVVPDPARESAESRMVTKFLEKLAVFSPTKTRVITIQFTSRDPELAARTANTIAQLYLQEQSAAKRATAKIAAEALSSQITDLRMKLAKADAEREQYRLQSGLFVGSNNLTISGQQLADINADLSKARASQADAQAKAELIRQLIREGKSANVADVINNDIVRRVSDQRFTAQAQLGREARTLLPGHPRIKELQAQLSEYDSALKSAAKQAASSLENEAKIAGQRVANLEAVLNQQKQQAGVSSADEVKLRALDRFAQSLKDQLDSSTAKYQEALARQSSTATPADARVISSATKPQEPSFPKKVPFVLFGTAAALILSIGFVLATELLGGAAAPEAIEPGEDRIGGISRDGHRAEERTAAQDVRWPFVDAEPETEKGADPAFASPTMKSTKRPSIDSLRDLAGGGLVGTVVSYLKGFGRSAEESRADDPRPGTVSSRANLDFGWEDDVHPDHAHLDHGRSDDARLDGRRQSEARRASAALAPLVTEPGESAGPSKMDAFVDRIVAAHVPGRGLHIVGTGVDAETNAKTGTALGIETVIDLGRRLAAKGRAIIVDLNRLPAGLAVLADPAEGQAKVRAMRGLAELLGGEASFAEVIHRDQASRLHFIPTGLQEADFRDFDLILDALSETYDFIILLTPDYPTSEIARIMAPYADFVLLAMPRPDDAAAARIEADLLAAGAREVLVAGAAKRRSLEVA